DPALPVRPGGEGARGRRADEERPRRRREAVRSRPRVGTRACRRAARVDRRVAALQDRPLPREDGHRRDRPSAVRELDGRADLEPQLHLLRRDHDGGGLRGRGSRPLLRPGGSPARRRRQSPHAGGPLCAMEAPARGDPQTIKDAQVALSRAVTTADPEHYVRGQYDGYRSIDGVAPDSTTETYVALRLEIENWRWSGVPFFIRTGKRLPVTQTELRLVFKHPPRLGFAAFDRAMEPNQLVVKLDPTTGIRLELEAHRADGPGTIHLDMDFAAEGGEGATPYEVLLHAALVGESTRFTRQDAVEETWRVFQPLLDAPPRVHPYTPGTWGPEASDALV